MYDPVIVLIFEWFARRRGLAGGILWSGAGVGGVILPFLVNYLLDNYSYHLTMTIIGISYFVMNGLALIPIKRRIPLEINDMNEVRRSRVYARLVKRKEFWAGSGMVCVTGLGMFLPVLWIPSQYFLSS